mmetsp:Transcript_9746/g.24244  ORF Transcript_9746/g.24244 Transcript_9746/m.24244 type:complete len:1206 (-) Transcript_9746:212-3829(-)
MPPKGQGPSLAEAVRSCKKAALNVVEAAKVARLFVEDCKGLSGFAKRLTPLLDDLEDNVPEPGAEDAGVAAVQALEVSLVRAHAAVSACATMGPFYALMNEAAVMGEFVNAAADMQQALAAINVKALKVDATQTESLGLIMQQLQRLAVSYTPCNSTSQMLVELRNEAEALRTGVGKAFPHTELSAKFLKDCTVAQLGSDVGYLRGELAAAQAARKHVEAFFLAQLLAMEEPLVPKDAQAARAAAGQTVVVATPAQPAAPEPSASVDPVPIVQDLLTKLVNTGLPVEQRAAALRPLVAAAGLDPGGAAEAKLHSGAVLYALTDPECAAKVVALVNEPGTDAVIKGWLLALVLSLVHPEQGLHPGTQAALMRTGLPAALCRLMVSPTTPPEQRLQAMAMLRVLIHDPQTHKLMVEAKVIHALVAQVGDVKMVKGQAVAAKAAPAAPAPVEDTRAGKGGKDQKAKPAPGSEFGLDQQITELAVLMLADMAPGQYKADILTAGGVIALCQRLGDAASHERVQVAAAGALSVLMVDGAIAVEAARNEVLAGLLAMLTSGSAPMAAAAKKAVKQMLTPTPPTSASTAAVVYAAANAPVVNLPPQGKAAKLSGGGAGSTGGKAPDAVAAVAAKSTEEVVADLFVEMGRAISPASTSALMDMLRLDDPDLLPLVLKLLPLTATDPNCRAAIMGHGGGMPVLLREAGTSNADAIEALRRVACDLKLRAQCAGALTQALVAAGAGTPAAANLARAIANVGTLPAGSERDKASVASVAAFAAEVMEAQGVPPLVALARSTDPRTKSCGVLALRPMAMFGELKVRQAIVAADALVALADAAKATDVAALDAAAVPLAQAACDTLAGLGAVSGAVQTTIFSSLSGFMSSASTVPAACAAMLAVAGASGESYGLLHKAGVTAQLLAVLDKGPDAGLAAPARLFAALVAYSTEAAEAACEADACAVLPGVLTRGDEVARAAAAAAAGYVMKRGEKGPNQFADRKGLNLLIDTLHALALESPHWEDACHALGTLAAVHEGSRGDTSRTVKGWLLRGSVNEATSGARVAAWLSHSPKGREIMFSDDLVDALIKQLGNNAAPDAQRWSADALVHAASAGQVALTLAAGSPAGSAPTVINPKPMIVNKGAVDALVQMLASPVERVVYEAAFALESLCSSEEGLQAAKRSRAKDALQGVVQAGKRGEVGERTAKAAYGAYIKVM